MKTVTHRSAEDMGVALAATIAAEQPRALILPGGSSPRPLITALAKHNLDWGNLTITTSDERCVPQDHVDSNAQQVRTLLTAEGVIPNILPLWQDDQDTLVTIENRLNHFVFNTATCVLGMGPDAHIASLFPHVKPLETSANLQKVHAPKPPPERISLNLETLCSTQRLILLVVGEEKQTVLERISHGELTHTPLAHLLKHVGDRIEIHSA